MDKEFAILVLNSSFRSARELAETARAVKAFSSEKEGVELKLQFSVALSEIAKINEYIFELLPEMRAYVDARIDKYGRFS